MTILCPMVVSKDSNRKMCDKTNDHGNIGITEVSLSHKGDKSLQACNVVGSEVQENQMTRTMWLWLVMNIKIKWMNILQIFRLNILMTRYHT